MSKALIAIDKSKSYRVYCTVTTDMVQEACDIHDTTPLAAAGLGRVLTAAGLMGIMLKNPEDKLTIIFKGDGPARQILATAYGNGAVKGFIADPYIQLPLTEEGKLDVGGSLGIGDLIVIRDLGLKEPYVGTIALVSGEIADDLTAYFYISEQQNSSVALGVRVEKDLSIGAAGGLIIQMLPNAEEGAIDALEELVGDMRPLTAIINTICARTKGMSQTGMVKALMEEIFKDMPEEYMPEVLDERDINWNCDCSGQRLEKVLISIGKKDLAEIIEEDGKAELQCQFCLKKYDFNKEELLRIYSGI
ncbi:MAG: Hsp33 family molecular chaperone HslO [Clostridiales bacterium]|nr:Hsp33 family molecular chaperone HslO [Clostridiales bacterium]